MSFPCAVVTVSDRVFRGVAEDTGGARVAELLDACEELTVTERCTVPDEQPAICSTLLELSGHCALVVTTGGTGLGPRDVTPEATIEVIERHTPGLEEAMRAAGREKTPLAMLSRAVVGARGSCLILNLPGSPSGIEDGLEAVMAVLPHALRLLAREVSDCADERRRMLKSP